MKKLISKIYKSKKNTPPSSRITTDTVAEHREHVLAGGRKFKYPMQYAKHRLVFNAIIITFSAVVLAAVFGWWLLYPQQNTSEFMYRVTKIIPVPVAVVDGQPVLYSDYLMAYRSSVYYLENKEQVKLKTDDGKRQTDYIKQQSMQGALEDAYAHKLAKDLDLSVSENELASFIKADQQSVNGEVSEQTYYAVVLDYYNWSPEEYKHVTKNKLLRVKVAYAVDKQAQSASSDVSTAVTADPKTDFKNLATSVSTKTGLKVSTGTSGWVPKTNQDGGLAQAASNLQKSAVSSVIKSTKGDAYYLVRLLDSKDDQVSYEYISIPLTTFNKSLQDLISSKKVQKFISIPDSSS